jgi:hypothetical protein
MGQQSALIIAALVFSGAFVIFIFAAMRPERGRRMIFEGLTGRRYGEDQRLRAPTRAVQQVTAIFCALVFGALSALFLVLAIEYKNPATIAREKQEMDRYFREFHAARAQQSAEKFSKNVQAGYPVDGETRSRRGEQVGARQPTTALDSKSEGKEKPKPEAEGRTQ